MSKTMMIAGNWKMNNDQAQTREFIEKLENWMSSDEVGKLADKAIEEGKAEIVIAPPFMSIPAAVDTRRSEKRINIAAQNVYHEPKGAYTGEISLSMLEEAGCKYVIIGHSERRHVFGEDNALLKKKIIATLESNVLPIYCVGEVLTDREAGNMEKVLRSQLEDLCRTLTSDVISEMLVIAYEPVWAIGTGKAASEADANQACRFVRKVIEEKFSTATADAVRILYGGSVKADNCANLLGQQNIDGLLIGGASLDVDTFTRIIAKAVSAVK